MYDERLHMKELEEVQCFGRYRFVEYLQIDGSYTKDR